MRVTNYQQAIESLYPYLEQYLSGLGINTHKKFKCINPKHEDSSPSMSLHPNKTTIHCFGCSYSGNIFHVASLLENKPSEGQGFIDENLLYLANKFDISVETEPLTEEQLYELETYRSYKLAAEIITSGLANGIFEKAVKGRGWSPDICSKYGVGCVKGYKEFKETLKAAGLSVGFLRDVDLDREDIFGEDRLIFTIRDHLGRPVGFASRNLSFNEETKDGTKYVNQRGTGVKCNIYRKSERLFGFDVFLKSRASKDEQLYIFEGYSDVVTAAQFGITNTCAIGGTALTLEHIALLKRHGCYDVILCLDGDDAGQNETERLLDNILGAHKDLKVNVVCLPSTQDPDDFLKVKSKEEFQKLRKWTAFEWRLNRFKENEDPDNICKLMIPLIINESSYVLQERMSHYLAKFTGITLNTIKQEVNRLQNQKAAEEARERQLVIDKLSIDLRKNPAEAEFALHEATSSLFDLTKRHDKDAFSEASCVSAIMKQKDFEEKKNDTFSGFILGPDLANLEQALAGNWKKDIWFCIGGKPNCGKTSFLSKFLYSIADNRINDACVIYHTIDDTFEQVLPKFVCVAEGSKLLTINQTSHPSYHIGKSYGDKLLERRGSGYSKFKDLVSESRLIIKDANDGNSLAFADMIIRYYKDKFPDRNIVYVLDNFHKLSDLTSIKDERVRFKEMSKMAKSLATSHHVCVITTVEYKKIEREKEANNSDIGETGQIEYDANIIAHFHNDIHERGEQALHYHEWDFKNGEGSKKCPRISFTIAKNKVSSFKDRLWFDFYPDSSDFVMVRKEQVGDDFYAHKTANLQGNSNMKEEYDRLCAERDEKGFKKGWEMWQLKDIFELEEDAAKNICKIFEVDNRKKQLNAKNAATS